MNLIPRDSVIPLNKNYRLHNTGTHWVLEKYIGINGANGKQMWSGIAWSLTLQQALNDCLERSIRAAGPVSLAEAMNACHSARQELEKICTGVICEDT